MPPKTMTTCNWVPSTVIESTLKDFVTVGYLLEKSVMHYRAPDPAKERPQPKDGEIIVFTDHMTRGFSPPDSKFFRDVLHFFKLHPQDIGPNLYQTSVTSKFFVKYTFKKNPTPSFLEKTST